MPVTQANPTRKYACVVVKLYLPPQRSSCHVKESAYSAKKNPAKEVAWSLLPSFFWPWFVIHATCLRIFCSPEFVLHIRWVSEHESNHVTIGWGGSHRTATCNQGCYVMALIRLMIHESSYLDSTLLVNPTHRLCDSGGRQTPEIRQKCIQTEKFPLFCHSIAPLAEDRGIERGHACSCVSTNNFSPFISSQTPSHSVKIVT